MTVGQHDDAWLDVMNRQVPSISNGVQEISAYIKLQTQFEMLKELKRLNIYTDEEYIRDIKMLARSIGFIFSED